jgi:hypothetical protein
MKDRKRLLAVGAALAAIVVGGGAALAASGSSDPASSFLADVAKRLGISETKLADAIKDAQIARVDAAQARGDLTKEQADALKERIRSGDEPAILPGFRGRGLGPGPLGIGPLGRGLGLGHHGFGLAFAHGGEVLQAAAGYLGVTEAELRASLAGGKSLAQVAKDRGKSVDGLKDAVKQAIRADVDRAVEGGMLTKEQGDRLYDRLSGGVDRLVDGKLGFRLRFRGDHRGFKFEFRHDDRDGPGAGLDRAPEPDERSGAVF